MSELQLQLRASLPQTIDDWIQASIDNLIEELNDLDIERKEALRMIARYVQEQLSDD
jgi:hypothetical protein